MLDNSLNGNRNLQCIKGRTPEEILGVLSQMLLPYKIVSIYALNNTHYCWFIPSEQIKIVKKKTKE